MFILDLETYTLVLELCLIVLIVYDILNITSDMAAIFQDGRHCPDRHIQIGFQSGISNVLG